MKKILSIVVLAMFSTMLFSQVVLSRGGRVLYDAALEDVDSITFVTGADGEMLEPMSPSVQKEKLIEIGEEFIEKFRPKDQRDLIELADYLVYKYESYDWEPAYEHYKEDLPFLRQLVRGISTVANGDVSHNLAMEVYKFPRFTGVFAANDSEETWEYVGKADNIVLRFKNKKGEDCEAVLTGVGETIEVEFEYETDSVAGQEWTEELWYNYGLVYVEEQMNYDYGRYVYFYDENGNCLGENYYETWETIPAHYEYQGQYTHYRDVYYRQPNKAVVPSKITFALKEGTTEHIALEMNIDVKKSSHVNYDFNLRIANLSFMNETSVDGLSASVNFEMKYGTETLLSARAVAPSILLIDKSSEEDYEDWLWKYSEAFYEDDEDVNTEGLVKTGFVFADVDIMNQLQIRASSKEVANLYRGLDKIDSYYDSKDGEPEHYWDRYYYQYDYNKAVADWYNTNAQVGLYYNSSVMQAELQMDLELDEWTTSEWNDETGVYEEVIIKDYDQTLVLYFPENGTTYEFEDYFTEVAFGSLFDLAEELVNNYIKLLEYNDIEPIEF